MYTIVTQVSTHTISCFYCLKNKFKISAYHRVDNCIHVGSATTSFRKFSQRINSPLCSWQHRHSPQSLTNLSAYVIDLPTENIFISFCMSHWIEKWSSCGCSLQFLRNGVVVDVHWNIWSILVLSKGFKACLEAETQL